ncbi:MAG TPA: phosphatidylglycerol lysyltransferase domain-containing protein [Candidatus Sulfotelmatobacter sp.]|nr:phosphatidylglycerol lysyltransferase domain-containing protein [Candidatus Sulfotelmatobacter sp.]
MAGPVAADASRLSRIERRRLRWFFAGILSAIGVLDVLSALLFRRALRDQALQALLPTQVSLGGRTGVVLIGLALVMLASGIARGKRVAWRLTSVLLLASAVLHLVTDLDLEEAIIAAWLCLGLWWMRRHFAAASDPAGVRRGSLALVAGVGLALLYAYPGSWLLRHQLTPTVTAGRTLSHLGHALVHTSGPYQALTARARWFLESLPVVTWALLLYGLASLLRPVVLPAATAAGQRDRVRTLLRTWGHNPVSHLCLLDDKRYLWLGTDTCIAYRLQGRVALVLGDPIGPPAGRVQAIETFLDYCERQDWTPAFYQTEADEPYRQLGFTLIPIGLDAVVRLEAFDLSGSKRAQLRQALHRCERGGIAFSFMSSADAWRSAARELKAVSDQWLRGKGREMAFSLGSLETIRDDPDLTVGLARDATGHLIAFVSWLPVPARRGWTLDLMRRRPDSLTGVMEALLTASLLEAKRRGLAEVSLAMAPLALPETPAIGKTYRLLYPRLDRVHGARSLSRFKAKFAPEWEPRYLAVSAAASVPEVLVALLRAHYPELRIRWQFWRRVTNRSARPDAGTRLTPAIGKPSAA